MNLINQLRWCAHARVIQRAFGTACEARQEVGPVRHGRAYALTPRTPRTPRTCSARAGTRARASTHAVACRNSRACMYGAWIRFERSIYAVRFTTQPGSPQEMFYLMYFLEFDRNYWRYRKHLCSTAARSSYLAIARPRRTDIGGTQAGVRSRYSATAPS